MSDRQLYQVGWAGGQTDGETSEQTVRSLINVELDKHGELVRRDPMEAPTTTIADVLRVFRMVADPTTDSPGGWTFHLKANTLEVFDDQGVLSKTLAFTEAATFSTEGRVFGGLLFLAFHDNEGRPVGNKVVYASRSGSRFQPPEAPLSGRQMYGTADEDVADAQWFISDHTTTKPALHSKDNTIPGFDFPEFITDVFEMGDAMGTDPAAVGIIFYDYQVSEDDNTQPSFAETTLLRYRVQFKYANGQVSEASNPTSVVLEDGAALAFSVMVNPTIGPEVSQINIYREIVVAGTGITELLFAVPLYSDDIEDDNDDIAGSFTSGQHSKEGLQAFMAPDFFTIASGISGWSWNEGGGVWAKVEHFPASRDNPGEAILTSGWRRVGTTMVFHAPFYTADGETSLKYGTVIQDELYDLVMPTTFAFGAISGQRRSVVMGGASPRIPYGSISDVSDTTFLALVRDSANSDRSPSLPPELIRSLLWIGAGDTFDMTCGYSGGTQLQYPYPWFDGPFGIPPSRAATPVSMFYDSGQAGLSDYETVYGVSEEEAVLPHLGHIAVASGRLVGVNVSLDGEHQPSRLMWSEYGRYGAFTESSYIDYGDGDAGRGVGVAKHGARLLVLNEASINALDISGGADMTWRSVGAWKDVGCLDEHSFVETPFGVFFCDKYRAYLWDGQQLRDTVSNQHRTIEQTYGAFVEGGFKTTGGVAYYPGRRQVWIIRGITALVYDIERDAWHQHNFYEMDVTGRTFGIAETAPNTWSIEALSTTGGSEGYLTSKIGRGNTGLYSIPMSINTGPITMGAPEIVKKLKRVYVETEAVGSGTFTVTANGDTPTVVTNPGSSVSRVSKSARGNSINLTVAVPSGETWRGSIKGIGLSFKPKRLK